MRKIILLAVGAILVGGGCAVRPVEKLSLTETAVNFCQHETEIAQKRIASFTPSETEKKYFEAWKRRFMEVNALSEEYYSKHIFPYTIRAREVAYGADVGLSFDVYYYYMPSDIYLDSSNGVDYVLVKKKDLHTLEDQTVSEILNQREKSETIKPSEPQPAGGRVPGSTLTQYPWGDISTSNLISLDQKVLPQTVAQCESALALLRTCHPDIEPASVVYKPIVGVAMLEGWVPTQKQRQKSDCVTGRVDLFKSTVVCENACPPDELL